MLSALLRRRRRLIVAWSPPPWRCPPRPCSRSAARTDVVVYNGRSQYGDEQVVPRLRGGHGHAARAARRDGAGALRAAASPRATRRRPTSWSPPTWPTCGAPRRRACWRPSRRATLERQVPAEYRDPDGDWWGCQLRIRTPMRSTERVPAGRDRRLRGPRRAALQGPALPAHVEQRVQPVARRRHAGQARRGGHGAAAAVLDGQRPADPRLRRRRAGGDRRGPLRRRA